MYIITQCNDTQQSDNMHNTTTDFSDTQYKQP
jgi:hypothetical protein